MTFSVKLYDNNDQEISPILTTGTPAEHICACIQQMTNSLNEALLHFQFHQSAEPIPAAFLEYFKILNEIPRSLMASLALHPEMNAILTSADNLSVSIELLELTNSLAGQSLDSQSELFKNVNLFLANLVQLKIPNIKSGFIKKDDEVIFDPKIIDEEASESAFRTYTDGLHQVKRLLDANPGYKEVVEKMLAKKSLPSASTFLGLFNQHVGLRNPQTTSHDTNDEIKRDPDNKNEVNTDPDNNNQHPNIERSSSFSVAGRRNS